MTLSIVVILAILFAAIGFVGIIVGGVILATSSQRAQKQSATIPGVDVPVPQEWALGHDPEARLHRRIGAVVSSLDSTIGKAGVADLETRARLMLDATAIDNQLVAIWSLPRASKPAALAEMEPRVAALEHAAAAMVTAPGLDGARLPDLPPIPPMPTPEPPAAAAEQPTKTPRPDVEQA